jgi:hypothetical protein
LASTTKKTRCILFKIFNLSTELKILYYVYNYSVTDMQEDRVGAGGGKNPLIGTKNPLPPGVNLLES